MQFEEKAIIFTDLDSMTTFVSENNLSGKIKLTVPINDNSGNVLIQEKILIKDNMIRKLKNMDGQYKPFFKIGINEDILNKLQATITAGIFKIMDSSRNEFVQYLFKNTSHNYKAYIRNSFRTKQMILEFYKVHSEHPDLFDHFALIGLVSLGIVIQRKFTFRFINRNSFLAGLFCDTGLLLSEDWLADIIDEKKYPSLIKKSIEYGSKINVPQEVLEAIGNHQIVIKHDTNEIREKTPEEESEAEKQKTTEEIMDAESEDEKKAGDTTEEAEGEDDSTLEATLQVSDFSPDAAKQLTEILKLAKYITNTTREISSKENFAEELVCIIAYNSEKGYFQKTLVAAIIQCFKEYEQAAKKMIRIANIENKCKYGDSAWAYPKPKATQIVCRKKINKCPLIYHGWDIKVVSPQQAYGWIGTTLYASTYPKCLLEKELEKIK